MQSVGVVAIGRNEGDRLKACLASIPKVPIVYVDSGSTDGSVAYAKAHGALCVELDLGVPFTAARARNAGFERLVGAHPQLEFVMFVDGDCALDENWLATALARFAGAPQLAAVCGRRKERFPNASIYNLVCDIEWDSPVGRALACGGDAVYRVDVLRELGGFDPLFIAGEEPELCFRIRAAGYYIERLDAPMTYHDAAMTRFRQWWKRTERSGYAYWLNAHKHGFATEERFRVKQVANILVWGGGIVLALLTLLMMPSLSLAALICVVTLLLYLRLVYKYRLLKVSYGGKGRWIYPGLILLGKIAQFKGVVFGMYRTWFAVPHRLVEYK